MSVVKAGQKQGEFMAESRPALVNSLHGRLAQNAVRYPAFHVKEEKVRRVARHLGGLRSVAVGVNS